MELVELVLSARVRSGVGATCSPRMSLYLAKRIVRPQENALTGVTFCLMVVGPGDELNKTVSLMSMSDCHWVRHPPRPLSRNGGKIDFAVRLAAVPGRHSGD